MEKFKYCIWKLPTIVYWILVYRKVLLVSNHQLMLVYLVSLPVSPPLYSFSSFYSEAHSRYFIGGVCVRGMAELQLVSENLVTMWNLRLAPEVWGSCIHLALNQWDLTPSLSRCIRMDEPFSTAEWRPENCLLRRQILPEHLVTEMFSTVTSPPPQRI